MKRMFLILPLAIVMANCSSSKNATSTSGTSSTTGAAGSVGVTTDAATGVDATASGTGSAGTTSTTGSTSAAMGTAAGMGTAGPSGTGTRNTMSSTSTGSYSNSATGMASSNNKYSSDVYDPNNFMQNPEKYKTPAQLGAAGGWTYNKDWRRNTNFSNEAVGQWQLSLTPDVLAYLKPDTSRPETYASYWTPEAMMKRSMMAAAMTTDSMNASAGMSGGTNGMTATAALDSSGVSGAGTTGTVATGGAAMTGTDSTTGMNPTATMLTAVNGNSFMLPSLNLFLENGSFTSYTGSNNLTGNVTIDGNNLRFQNLVPSSAFTGIGGFDQSVYIDRLSRVDSYDMENGQIRLKQGDQVLMVLSKMNQ